MYSFFIDEFGARLWDNQWGSEDNQYPPRLLTSLGCAEGGVEWGRSSCRSRSSSCQGGGGWTKRYGRQTHWERRQRQQLRVVSYRQSWGFHLLMITILVVVTMSESWASALVLGQGILVRLRLWKGLYSVSPLLFPFFIVSDNTN
jgi:hypothetical protein